MMRTSHCRRPGLSLTEVLVALFVMALGIISLMTLFPLGAVQMGQALRDDRSGQTASQADGIVRLWWQTEVVEKNQLLPGSEDPFFLTLDNPNYPNPATVLQPQRALDNSPSYPVVLDSIGWHSQSVATGQWISLSVAEPRLPRRTMKSITNLIPQAVRTFSMMDDITFTETGIPDTNSGSLPNKVVREGAFNWCAVIQRPNNANRYTADFKVCVFHTKGLYGGHVPGLAPTNAETIYSLTNTLLAPPALNGTQVVLNVPVGNLPIRSGSWIMDGSNSAVTNFYRIQSVTDNGASTTLELDTPLKGTTPITQMYIIRGLADVFDRPQLTASGYSRQAP